MAVIAPVKGVFVKPLLRAKVFIAAKAEYGGHVSHTLRGRNESILFITDLKLFLHVTEGDELPDAGIGPDGVGEIAGIIDRTPQLRPVDDGRVIDGQREDSALIEQREIMSFERRAGAEEKGGMSPVDVSQKDIVPIAGKEHGSRLEVAAQGKALVSFPRVT